MNLKLDKLVTAGLAVALGVSIDAAGPAAASTRFDLEGDLKMMVICNDGDPYIYANNIRTWNKAYDNTSFTANANGKVASGKCSSLVLDVNDEYPNDVPGWVIVKGSEAKKLVSMGWDILFDNESSYPSKHNSPRPITSSCIGQLDDIPMDRIKTFCFK